MIVARFAQIAATVGLLLVFPYGALRQECQDDVLDIEQLRVLASHRPARFSSLSVSYGLFQDPSSFSVGRHIPHMFHNVLVDATTGRFSIDRSMEIAGPEHDFAAQTVTITFDGEVQGAFLPDPMIGIVTEGTDVDGLTESGLWGAMLLSDPQPDGLGVDDGSLESLLAHGTVRDQLELVGDTPCHVVDAFYEGERYATVWLDVERGLLPMKRVGYGHDRNVNSAVTVNSVMYLEDEQVWLPESWRTEVQVRGETLRNQTVIQPESVELDPPVTDEDFRPQFPPGTMVTDQISGQAYRIADSGEIGEILYERVDGEWVSVARPTATENASQDDSPAAAPILESLAELMEFARQAQAAKPPERNERDAETETPSPDVATGQPAPDSKRPARSAPVSTAPVDVGVPDPPRQREQVQPVDSDVASAADALPSRSPWPWIVGATTVMALLGIGYAAWRRSSA